MFYNLYLFIIIKIHLLNSSPGFWGLASKGRSHMLIIKKILSKSYEIKIEEVKEDLNLNIEKENKISFLLNEILKLRDKLEQKE